ncbi:DUF2252 domain-containing protein [Radiobacillus sp. PE A8.2]|uniref:DUF2252 domain-containing protein n=1 Tax=Radiobacillus sp. PE A8.2 TaxID=3380349 RepID=UPI0038903D63
MVQNSKERISETKNYLRKQTLHTILEQFDTSVRDLSKKDRRAKYDKMKQDSYSFYRGSAYLFYYDVTNIPFTHHTPEDKPTWLLGDLHMANFSGFQNENEVIVFDVDDFDEGYLGSYLYDVLRMVVSIRLFASNKDYLASQQDFFVETYLKAYYKQLKKFVEGKENPVKTIFTVENTKGPIKKALKKLEERKVTHELDKQTMINEEGNRVFNRDNLKLHDVSNNEYKELMKIWDNYIECIPEPCFKGKDHYQIKDIVKKTGAGIGSIGLKRFYVLIEGQHDNEHHDDIILEVKEARAPVPAYFFEYNEVFWEENNHHGKRVIKTQEAMHHMADPYLGFFTMQNRHYYVRERSPYEKDVNEKYFVDEKDMKQTAKAMGKVTAKIHARADADIDHGLLTYHSEHEILQAIGGDSEGFIKEMTTWSKFYMIRVEKDYQLFLEWLEDYFYKKN